MNVSILLIAVLTSMASAIVGVFLVLRKMSMMTDAISHTVLLGIVLVFMIVGDLNSPWLIIGATIMGVLTVYIIELIVKSKRTSEDAATGVVFPLLFGIAVIIISLQFRNVHLDIDAVLLGNIEFAIFDQLVIGGTEIGPRSLYIMLGVTILNFVFFTVFYKELKIVSFDPALATVLGISPIIIHYVLMFLVSLTAVTSFNAVGSILVIALMIGPAMTAILFTKNLFTTAITSVLIGILNSVFGYITAIYFDITISGTISVLTLVVFLLAFFFNSKNGVLFAVIRRKLQKIDFNILTLLIHIQNHQEHEDGMENLLSTNIYKEFGWSPSFYRRNVKRAMQKDLVYKKDNYVLLTTKGEKLVEAKLKELRYT